MVAVVPVGCFCRFTTDDQLVSAKLGFYRCPVFGLWLCMFEQLKEEEVHVG